MQRPAWCALLLAAAFAAPADGQTPVQPPPSYALTNVRIVTAPGRVIERGTIVIRDGRIAAVGAQVAVPAGAVTMDLAGMSVYPGLIDAAATLGLAEPGGTGGGFGGGGGGGAAAQRGPDMSVRPDRLAAADYEPTDAELEALRAAGVTTVGLAFPSTGVFPGQTAVVGTGSAERASQVLRSPVAMQVALGRRRGGYPGTLMATLAFIEQSFHDAAHASRVSAAFVSAPAAAPRPTFDEQAQALAMVTAGRMPAWYFASSERDVRRVIELARDARTPDYAIVGVQEGFRVLDELRAAGRPLIVSVNFPSAAQITGRAHDNAVAPLSGRNAERDRADSLALAAARANPATLLRAGLTVALSGYGLERAGDLRERVRAAIEAGLPADEALRALTLTPARMLGVDNAVGTLEVGKLANLVVADGELFGRETRIRHVFVEGRHFEIREQPPQAPAGAGGGVPAGGRGAGGGGGPAGAAAVAGAWSGSAEMMGRSSSFTLNIAPAAGSALRGTLALGAMGSIELSGERTGADLVMRGVFTPPGMSQVAITLNGRVEGAELRGSFVVPGMGSTPFTARRVETPRASNSDGGIR